MEKGAYLRKLGKRYSGRLPDSDAVITVDDILKVVLECSFDTGLVDTFIELKDNGDIAVAVRENFLMVWNRTDFAVLKITTLALIHHKQSLSSKNLSPSTHRARFFGLCQFPLSLHVFVVLLLLCFAGLEGCGAGIQQPHPSPFP